MKVLKLLTSTKNENPQIALDNLSNLYYYSFVIIKFNPERKSNMNKLFNFTQAKGKWHKFTSFNLGGGAKLYKNFAQKLLAVSLCAAMVLLGVPRGQNFVAEAANEAISNTLFITKKDLLKLCEETNDGNGLLATGTGTDVKLRINFGHRPEDAYYYTSAAGDPVILVPNGKAVAGDLIWLVTGSEDSGLVLYSEEPLFSAFELRGDSLMDSRFHSDANRFTWVDSALRGVFQSIFAGDTEPYDGFFGAAERGLMLPSTLTTYDFLQGGTRTYTTEDTLYAPRFDATAFDPYFSSLGTRVTLGSGDSLSVASPYWGGVHWLRSPKPGQWAPVSARVLVALPGLAVGHDQVDYGAAAPAAAFTVDVTSLLFASAASSAEGGSFEAISAGTPMTLRLEAPAGSSAKVGAVSGTIGALGADGWTLMVQGVTDDGQNWSYSKAIESDSFTTVSTAEVATAGSVALSSFDNCEVWLEKPVESGGTLTYAVRAEETLPGVPVTGVSLSETAKSLAVGESFDLTATVSPEDATNKNVTWTSSETSVATVAENGTVKALKVGTTTITVTTADGAKTATCEVTVTQAGGAPPPTPDEVTYLESTVEVNGYQQRLRVYDTNKILPAGTQLKAEAVTRHEHMDDDGREVEHLLSYNISLLDANGASLPMPLTNSVELCFEVLDFLDEDELDAVLVQQFNDREFNETRVERDGARWVLINTDHFSPYALIDELSDAEKAALGKGKTNVKTGDHAVQVAVAGLGSILVLALGIMLRLITSKKKFEE